MTSGGLAAVSSSAFAALYSAFGKYDVVHIHAEGPAFFTWLPKMFGKRVVVTVHGIDWQREKWQSGLGSKFIHQGEKNAAKYADEVIVLSKGVLNVICSLNLWYSVGRAKLDFPGKLEEYVASVMLLALLFCSILGGAAFLLLDQVTVWLEMDKALVIALIIYLLAYSSFRCCWKQMVWQQEKTISLKDGMMPRKMQLSFRLKKMNKVPSRLKSVQLDITSTWMYNTSKWT